MKHSQPRALQAGQSMALQAMVIGFVILPLMALTLDLPRLLWTREKLQSATDSAAAAAAWTINSSLFHSTGNWQLDETAAAQAANTAFTNATTDAALHRYTPTLTVMTFDATNLSAAMTAEATVPLFIGNILPAVTIRVEAEAQAKGYTPP